MTLEKIDRRAFLKKAGIFGIVCAGVGLGPYLNRNRKIFKKALPIMGTLVEIQIVHDDSQKAYPIMEKAFEEIRQVDRLMSRFRSDSDIGRANAGAFEKQIALSSETAFVVDRALHWSRVTGGTFDPAIGKLSLLWDVKHKTHRPSQELIERLAHRRLCNKIQLHSSTISFSDSDVMLDLGGIGKGYAVDQAANSLRKSGIEQGLVNLGGEVYALGGRTRTKSWRVGIKDPRAPQKLAQVLHLKNQAVATSGNYEQYFVDAKTGEICHHLLNPTLGKPAPGGFQSLTIMGDNCCDADALATGLFFYSQEKARQMLEQNTQNFEAILLG